MKMAAALITEKRKTFKNFSEDDRSRFLYNGDVTNRYLGVGEHHFNAKLLLNELSHLGCVEQYSKVSFTNEEKNLFEKYNDALAAIFVEDQLLKSQDQKSLIELNFKKAISISRFIEKEMPENSSVLEFGPGLGMLAFILTHKKIKKYTCVEAIVPILIFQQLLFLVSSQKNEACSFGFGNPSTDNSEKLIELFCGWGLPYQQQKFDVVVGVDFFEHISDHDFHLYINWLEKRVDWKSLIIAHGGFEKASTPSQYLFGFGKLLEADVAGILSAKFKTKLMELNGDLMLCNRDQEVSSISDLGKSHITSILDYETQKLRSLWVEKSAVAADERALFIGDHKSFLLNEKGVESVFTFSGTTGKIAGLFQNKQISSADDFKDVQRLFLFSFRAKGFIENPIISSIFKSKKISDRIFTLEKRR